MKEARKLVNQAGVPLWRLVISFFILKNLVMIPLISRVWGLTLRTTPDGYVSNANIKEALLKSPWIVLVGAILLGALLLLVWWQVYATVLGVAYAHDGKSARVRDLLKIAWSDIIHRTGPKNWPMFLYVIIVLPLTNLYHATSMIGSFVTPEYISDFIYSKTYLYIINISISLVAIFFALRWFYLLPSFCLKKNDFNKASKESFHLTKKKAIRSGFKLFWYGTIETIRLTVVPFLFVLAMALVTYFFVKNEPGSVSIFGKAAVRIAVSMVGSISSVLVYLSSMCYVVNNYYNLCKENDTKEEIQLPELPKTFEKHMTGRVFLVIITFLMGIAVSLFYLATLFGIKKDLFGLEDYFGKEMIVAHKGYSSKAPENTMKAFELADKSDSVNFIELDVWSTKDGIPVVIHNETIKDATGLPGNIYDYTYEELQNIPATYGWTEEEYKTERIPSLEEVISTYADSTPLLIEIKGYKKDEQLPAKIVALMEKYECSDTSIIHSGDYGALKAVKECNDNIKCGLIQAVVTGDCYDLPYADFLSVEHTFVNSQMVDQLHMRGKEIFVWTVNRTDSLEPLNTMAIDAYITDYPDTIAWEIDEDEDSIWDGIINQLPTFETDNMTIGVSTDVNEY